MFRNVIEINVNDYKGDFLLLDAYLQDEEIPFSALQIPKPNITATFAPEALHLDKLGFKMCTILRLDRVTNVTCIFKEGSPHSIQIPLMVQEAVDNTEFPKESVRYFSWDKGEYSQVDDLGIRLCRHAGEIATLSGLFRLFRYIKKLRSPSGCANDREATMESTLQLLKEEIDELHESLQSGNLVSIVEEFGDLVFDMALFATVLRESHDKTLSQVCHMCTEKMKSRHPEIEE